MNNYDTQENTESESNLILNITEGYFWIIQRKIWMRYVRTRDGELLQSKEASKKNDSGTQRGRADQSVSLITLRYIAVKRCFIKWEIEVNV